MNLINNILDMIDQAEKNNLLYEEGRKVFNNYSYTGLNMTDIKNKYEVMLIMNKAYILKLCRLLRIYLKYELS